MEVSPKYIYKMIEDNDKNKFTTLYYLLLKKFDRGDLRLEELHEEKLEDLDKERKSKNSSNRQKSQEKGFKVRESMIKRRQNSKPINVRNNSSNNRSRYNSSKRSRNSREDPRELPEIKQPNITVKDITVEVKEKITINTTTTNRGDSPIHNTPHYTKRNFYLSGRGYGSGSRSRAGGSRVTPHSNMGIRM